MPKSTTTTSLPRHPLNGGGRRRKNVFRIRHIVNSLSCLFVITLSAYYYSWLRWRWQSYSAEATTSSSHYQNHLSDQIDQVESPKIVYVHVGKTGGEWIKSQLPIICKTRRNSQLKQSCLQRFTNTTRATDPLSSTSLPSTLQNAVIGYIHTTLIYPKNIQYSRAVTHYMFSIRHPYERLQSWYIYNHPKSCDPREYNSPSCKTKTYTIESFSSSKSSWNKLFFHDCFPTFYDLVNHKKKEVAIGNGAAISCSSVLWNGIKGRNISTVKQPNHLYWNYHYYWEQTMAIKNINKKEIFVVRQESLKDDLFELETDLRQQQQQQKLGEGTTGSEEANPVTDSSAFQLFQSDTIHYVNQANRNEILGHSVHRHPTNDQKQQQHRELVCCEILRDEIRIYHMLIRLSQNLDIFEKQTTILNIYEQCGFDRKDSNMIDESLEAQLRIYCQSNKT